jgi:CRISPR-associated Csx10 family RAMP protein
MTHELRYNFKLNNPAVFSKRDGDPNVVQSDDFVPASAIWGALAAKYITTQGRTKEDAHEDADFRKWFLRGDLRFLNSYPVATHEDQAVRLLPTPLSIEKEKKSNKLFDLAACAIEGDEPENPTKRLGGFSYLTTKELYQPEGGITTQFYYHNNRFQPINRLKGRSDEGEGSIFVYEALQAGQEFAGRIIGEKAELISLCQKLNWNVYNNLQLSLGRSRNTQYGGAGELKLDAIHNSTDENQTVKPLEFTGEIGDKRIDSNYLIVTLTAPLLLQDDYGNPSTDFPMTELANRLNLKLIPEKSFARTITIGGYSAVWRLPRPQWTGFAAGSVFIFKMEGQKPAGWTEQFVGAETKGLGIRTGEGFGSFVLNWHGSQTDLTSKSIKKVEPVKPGEIPPASLKKLVAALVQKAWLEKIRLSAIRSAKNYVSALNSDKAVTPALLSRLEMRFRGLKAGDEIPVPEKDRLPKILADLKKPARERLVYTRNDEKKPLLDFLREVFEAKSLDKSPFNLRLEAETKEVTDAVNFNPFDVSQTAGKELYLALLREYLISFIVTLSRERRKPTETKASA